MKLVPPTSIGEKQRILVQSQTLASDIIQTNKKTIQVYKLTNLNKIIKKKNITYIHTCMVCLVNFLLGNQTGLLLDQGSAKGQIQL
jgi:hypothetical protein